jgi:hypothetical protein
VVEDLLHDVLGDIAVETGRERFTDHAECLLSGLGAARYSSGLVRTAS